VWESSGSIGGQFFPHPPLAWRSHESQPGADEIERTGSIVVGWRCRFPLIASIGH
jgi:hypothetical protein